MSEFHVLVERIKQYLDSDEDEDSIIRSISEKYGCNICGVVKEWGIDTSASSTEMDAYTGNQSDKHEELRESYDFFLAKRNTLFVQREDEKVLELDSNYIRSIIKHISERRQKHNPMIQLAAIYYFISASYCAIEMLPIIFLLHRQIQGVEHLSSTKFEDSLIRIDRKCVVFFRNPYKDGVSGPFKTRRHGDLPSVDDVEEKAQERRDEFYSQFKVMHRSMFADNTAWEGQVGLQRSKYERFLEKVTNYCGHILDKEIMEIPGGSDFEFLQALLVSDQGELIRGVMLDRKSVV